MILTKGPYRKLFGFGAVAVGLVAPLLLFAIVALLGAPAVLAVPAGLMQLGGILLFKYCFLNAGAYRQLFTEALLSESPPSPAHDGTSGARLH